MNDSKRPKGTRELLERVAQNLYRHKDNRSFYGIKKVGGKIKSHSLRTTDRKIADLRLVEWLADIGRSDASQHDTTLAMLLDRFERARSGREKSTRTAESGMIQEFERSFPRPIDTLVSRVRHSDVSEWLAKIAPGKRASTYNRWRLFARQLFALAETDGVVARSPFVDKLNRRAKKQKVQRLIPTAEEFDRIVAEIRRPTWNTPIGQHGGQRPMFQHDSADFAEFLGTAGVGQAEAVALRWEDIDLKAGTIEFVRRKTSVPFVIPIYSNLRGLLERLAATREATGPVFRVLNVKRALDGACNRLGLPHFTQRSLRAMKIKQLWESGVDVKIIAKWQGHGDGGKLILDTYTEVFGSNTNAYESEQLAKADGKLVAMPHG